MQDIHTMLSKLRRPRLLVSAARHGLSEYDRKRHLGKLLFTDRLPGVGAAVMRLVEIENRLNDARVGSDAAYNTARHVDVLIALMSEAAALQTTPELKVIEGGK